MTGGEGGGEGRGEGLERQSQGLGRGDLSLAAGPRRERGSQGRSEWLPRQREICLWFGTEPPHAGKRDSGTEPHHAPQGQLPSRHTQQQCLPSHMAGAVIPFPLQCLVQKWASDPFMVPRESGDICWAAVREVPSGTWAQPRVGKAFSLLLYPFFHVAR